MKIAIIEDSIAQTKGIETVVPITAVINNSLLLASLYVPSRLYAPVFFARVITQIAFNTSKVMKARNRFLLVRVFNFCVFSILKVIIIKFCLAVAANVPPALRSWGYLFPNHSIRTEAKYTKRPSY